MAAAPTIDVRALVADLVSRAEQSCLKTTTNRRNKQLLEDLSVALVALATQLAHVEQARTAPHIILPSGV